jgi:hypothetical protein
MTTLGFKIGSCYRAIVKGTTAYVFDTRAFMRRQGESYLGKVWIGRTGEWNCRYSRTLGNAAVGYLPINECLRLLGYSTKQFAK